MVEIQVLIGIGAVAAVGVVLWRQRQLCQQQIDRLDQQEAAKPQVQVTSVDVPPLASFPTAEDALDLLAPPKRVRKRKSSTPRKKATKKSS